LTRHLSPPHAAPNEDREQSSITTTSEIATAFTTEKLLALFCCEPVSNPYLQPSNSFNAPYAGCKIGAEQTAIARFIRPPAVAANLTLIVEAACGYRSSVILYRVTTVLLKASLGSEQYDAMNSRMACSQERLGSPRSGGSGRPISIVLERVV
jgi:hypothetical protein